MLVCKTFFSDFKTRVFLFKQTDVLGPLQIGHG